MSRDDFPDRGSRPRTASTGTAWEGTGKPLELSSVDAVSPKEVRSRSAKPFDAC